MAKLLLLFVASFVIGSSLGKKEGAKNLLGSELEPCCVDCSYSRNPEETHSTGYFRDGYCNTDSTDHVKLHFLLTLISFVCTLNVGETDSQDEIMHFRARMWCVPQ